ncbi:PTS sugar transporter subunit IIB [Listeria immobilis]|uniref:PTS sugar transporter subunit IIB n=1 Tax=Listeria immobilis TaxID=2713502 RepID=A0ABR6STT5_9LIST|nr:PTS sugar transporter subunit IIB [Listeria immobilis]MBC1482472.1 PTS sugar transporter subunit IIB [Listeria immobilis]MBC1506692.1 PTS sugar transporter subunit IIB [Listeria immobilis]MBC1508941.1 PTS sugar transporter subunit IIB [Listeria immobilis]MBC1515880.1 PTS sugar transporter subunit IIB [Listeria immobilis]MBC6297174.1 PTS sugar transporter subunit IIB [Listeria immobilis]
MEILTVCGMGFGTSLMLLMEIQDMAKKHGYKVDGEATDLSSAKGRTCDAIVASSEIAAELAGESAKVIPIINILDKKEIEEKVLPIIKLYFAS